MKKTAFVPLYRSIYEDLKQKIADGIHPPGTQLPYEHALCAQYGVERVTIRRALDLLVKEGLIQKRAGVGSFVSENTGAPTHNGQTPIILFIMQSNQNDIRHNTTAFNALLYFPTERACKEAGYSLLYASVQSADDVTRLSMQHDIAGAFMVSAITEDIMERATSLGFPAICVNTYDHRLLSILPDNVSGACAAIDHLVEAGHRRIAFIGGMPSACNAQERLQGYQRALAAHGISYDAALVADGHWTYDDGRAAIRSIMEALPGPARPTAVFAASDMMAIGAMDGIRQMGLVVPDDVSVVGFDNIDMSNFCSPPLTDIAIDVQQMAGVSVEHMMLLVRRGATAGDRYIIRLPATVVKRQSVRYFSQSIST